MSQFVVSAMYHFATLDDYKNIKEPLLKSMKDNNVKGTLLLAREGINGTIAGTTEGTDAVLKFIRRDNRLKDIVTKESYADKMPFQRTKVKLKKEIVTLGVDYVDPTKYAGEYVKPKDWNALISDPDTILIDTRNSYETAIGTFQNAIDPETETFREFPEYVAEKLTYAKNKKVAMFCTGGIRCEKSTAYLKQQGFEKVYHLEGGILKYLEEIPEEESMWKGECFVFDDRVAVKHGLEHGDYDQCHACRLPITEDDKQLPSYEKGVSCHHCIDTKTDEQRARYAEREKQIQIAKQRGLEHIGGEMSSIIASRREEKRSQKMDG